MYPKYNENGKLKKEMILVVCVLLASDLFRSPIYRRTYSLNPSAVLSAMIAEVPFDIQHIFLTCIRPPMVLLFLKRANQCILAAQLTASSSKYPEKPNSSTPHPTLPANLKHQHSSIRRAAMFALQNLHRQHPSLVPEHMGIELSLSSAHSVVYSVPLFANRPKQLSHS